MVRFKQASGITKVIILVLLIYMATSLLNLRGQIQETQQQSVMIQAKIADIQLENQKMSEAIENSEDPEVLERVARENGYVKQGETLYMDIAG